MKTVIRIAAVSSCMLATSVAVADDVPIYTPDLVSAELATALTVSPDEATSNALPGVQGFWADMVNTENVAAGGDGVYVAVLDTGMLPLFSPWFFSEANIAWDLGKGFSHDVYWDDTYGLMIGPLQDDRGIWTDLASGHGTHVTSTLVGFNVNDEFWVDGVAPDVTIIPVLVLDAWEVDTPYGPWQLGGGTDEMIAAGIYYVADLSDTLDGPVVINMSLGGPTPSPMIEAAIDYATAKGVVVVASAGNSGADGLGYPGGLDQVISTGAVGWAEMFTQGWRADVPEKLNKKDSLGNKRPLYLEDFSSRPNKDNLAQKHQHLDVSAPGAWVVGPYKPDFGDLFADTNYYYLSGTSMAAPHVAGIAAVVLGEYPDLAQAEMEAILVNAAAGTSMPSGTATVAFPFEEPWEYTATWGGGDYGKGFLQLDQALDKAATFY